MTRFELNRVESSRDESNRIEIESKRTERFSQNTLTALPDRSLGNPLPSPFPLPLPADGTRFSNLFKILEILVL